MAAFTATTLALAVSATPGAVQGAERQGYGSEAIKVAFTFNFARYSRWPSASRGPLKLCVSARADQVRAFATLERRDVSGRAIDVVELAPAEAPSHCDIVFIGAGAPRPEFCGHDAGTALTVTDRTDCPSMVELFQAGDQVRFNVALERVKASGLSMNPKLLALAANLRK